MSFKNYSKESERQENIHAKTFKITNEVAAPIFLEKNIETKKQMVLNLLEKMTYKKSLEKIKSDVIVAKTGLELDKIVSNLYLAQNLCKVIK